MVSCCCFFFKRRLMGFNELIYPVYFNLRRAGICMNKNAHFWGRGAGEAECCHIGLRGKRKLTGHSGKRSLHPVSCLPLSWLGGRLAMAHSSLFIKGILSKRNAGGICHPSCAHAWTHPAQGKSICIDMTSSIVLSSVLYQEACVVY